MKKKGKKRTSACEATADAAGDADLTRRVAAWFGREARDLPWRRVGRGGRRDAWRSLVSEVMLQQTQVSRVLEKYGPFIERFPTPAAMAAAGEGVVLAMWSGMGYYRRAKMLYAAAAEIVGRHGGEVPEDAATLRTLPGVGRYTAGAVASIVFGKTEPIVDGNVARVLMRIHGVEQTVAAGSAWCWARSTELATAAGEEVAGFNEGMMELGAVVCTPRSPRCGVCPVAGVCEARRRGVQAEIPTPKAAAKRSVLRCEVVVVRDGKGRLLVERRPAKGMWAGLWQAPTVEWEDAGRGPVLREVLKVLGLPVMRPAAGSAFAFVHQTTHREVLFSAVEVVVEAKAAAGVLAVPEGHTAVERRWVRAADLAGLGLSNAQKRILTREPDLFG